MNNIVCANYIVLCKMSWSTWCVIEVDASYQGSNAVSQTQKPWHARFPLIVVTQGNWLTLWNINTLLK